MNKGPSGESEHPVVTTWLLSRRIHQVADMYGLNVAKEKNYWRIYGKGIDVRVTDLKMIRPEDLNPYL